VNTLVARWKAARERREAIGYLSTLTDYELADIGLTRADIVAAVDGVRFADRANAHFGTAVAGNVANDRVPAARAA
jgi:uncharacterized protein YjiS (DUF1127 family)